MTSRLASTFQALFVALALAASACQTTEHEPTRDDPGTVVAWGTMREVLREGRSHARVSPAAVVRPETVGVGALAGLAGEITVLDGRVIVSAGGGAARNSASRVLWREGHAEDRAALLVLAEVPAWEAHELDACSDYDALDAAITACLRARAHDLEEPIPVRIRAERGSLELHVIAGACPIADPDGTPPWRHAGAFETAEIVGFFAQGAAGELTHHEHRSHLHAIVGDVMGHLDAVSLAAGAVLLLPAR